MEDDDDGPTCSSFFTDPVGAIDAFLFAGIPDHYPLKKKIQIAKSTSTVGTAWDIVQILLVIVACGLYVVTRYPISYETTQIVFTTEFAITQVFMADFLLGWYTSPAYWWFFADAIVIIDILTMFPSYYIMFTKNQNGVIDFLRCLRIFRLMRMFRTIKLIRNMNAIRRQVLLLTVTMTSMIYITASVIQLVENDIYQLEGACRYINSATNWKPSCTANAPANELCICSQGSCIARYIYGDAPGEPSGLSCTQLPFFNAVYFIIVTVATVGYGDITPSSEYAKAVVIVFILTSLILIPTRISKLQALLSLRSPFRTPYMRQGNDNHVIICGHVTNRQKLERFFKEFFHTDR